MWLLLRTSPHKGLDNGQVLATYRVGAVRPYLHKRALLLGCKAMMSTAGGSIVAER